MAEMQKKVITNNNGEIRKEQFEQQMNDLKEQVKRIDKDLKILNRKFELQNIENRKIDLMLKINRLRKKLANAIKNEDEQKDTYEEIHSLEEELENI